LFVIGRNLPEQINCQAQSSKNVKDFFHHLIIPGHTTHLFNNRVKLERLKLR